MADERRVAVVTGAVQGLGQAFSVRLAQDGRDLFRVDRYTEGAQATVAAITAADKGSLPFSTVVVTGKVVTAANAPTVSPTGPLAGS